MDHTEALDLGDLEWLSDEDIDAAMAGLSELPVQWFDTEPKLITEHGSRLTARHRWLSLEPVFGPSFTQELGIWKVCGGYRVTDIPIDGELEEWPMVSSVQAAVAAIGAHLADLMHTWGVKAA